MNRNLKNKELKDLQFYDGKHIAYKTILKINSMYWSFQSVNDIDIAGDAIHLFTVELTENKIVDSV